MIDRNDQRYVDLRLALERDPEIIPTRFGGFSPEQLRARAAAGGPDAYELEVVADIVEARQKRKHAI